MALPSLEAVGRVAAPDLMLAIADDIQAVEFLITQELESEELVVTELARHTFGGGGKRLRPAMVSLAARAVGKPYQSTRVIRAGASMEMIHMATLIHDDVIDESRTRRGRPTANSLYGNRTSILSGDVLLSKALRLLALDGDNKVIRTVAEAVAAMSEGEVAEVQAMGCLDLNPQAHFEIVRKKTAVFIECCCRIGAQIAGADERLEERLGLYGHHVGMAFQFADDILDFKGDPEKTGKAIGGDFREGCATLPLIHALARTSQSERHQIERTFGQNPDDGSIRAVVEMIDRAGGFDHTREVAAAHVQSAVASLAAIGETPVRECLYSIADFVVSRDR